MPTRTSSERKYVDWVGSVNGVSLYLWVPLLHDIWNLMKRWFIITGWPASSLLVSASSLCLFLHLILWSAVKVEWKTCLFIVQKLIKMVFTLRFFFFLFTSVITFNFSMSRDWKTITWTWIHGTTWNCIVYFSADVKSVISFVSVPLMHGVFHPVLDEGYQRMPEGLRGQESLSKDVLNHSA